MSEKKPKNPPKPREPKIIDEDVKAPKPGKRGKEKR
jgi:hypothetical protein